MKQYILFLFDEMDDTLDSWKDRCIFRNFYMQICHGKHPHPLVTYNYQNEKSIYWNFGKYIQSLNKNADRTIHGCLCAFPCYCEHVKNVHTNDERTIHDFLCAFPYYHEYAEIEHILRIRMMHIYENTYMQYENNNANNIICNEFLMKNICKYFFTGVNI